MLAKTLANQEGKYKKYSDQDSWYRIFEKLSMAENAYSTGVNSAGQTKSLVPGMSLGEKK